MVTATAVVAALASPVVVLGMGRSDGCALIRCLTAAMELPNLVAGISSNYWVLIGALVMLATGFRVQPQRSLKACVLDVTCN